MLSHNLFVTRVLLCALVLSGVSSEKCITCRRDTLEDCLDGERAAEYDDQRQDCSDSLPFCEVTVQEGLLESGEVDELRDVRRGCIKEETFTCATNADNVRTCTATCEGDLCNDFRNVTERVREYERKKKEEEEKEAMERPAWVIPVAVVVPLLVLAALGAVGFGVRSRNNRRNARDLKMTGEADVPLRKNGSAP